MIDFSDAPYWARYKTHGTDDGFFYWELEPYTYSQGTSWSRENSKVEEASYDDEGMAENTYVKLPTLGEMYEIIVRLERDIETLNGAVNLLNDKEPW